MEFSACTSYSHINTPLISWLLSYWAEEITSVIFYYVAVALVAASPIGEEVLAIPLGITLGLSTVPVVLTALAFNFLPALLISLVFHRAEHSTGPLKWLLRLRSQRVARVLDRAGMLGVIIATPWLGVYAVTVSLEMLGMRRRRLGSISIGPSAGILGSIIKQAASWCVSIQPCTGRPR